MDEKVLQRLATATQEARGNLSQREFAQLLDVSQSTVQSWENGKNLPNLENLEKLARMRGMLVEDFVAFLYDRTRGLTSKDILDRIEVMPSKDFAQVLRVMADRLDTAKNAPPVVEKRKKDKVEQRIKLELPLRQEQPEQELHQLDGEG